MRIGSLLVVALLAAGACKSDKPSATPKKLRKMDFKPTIDERGRLKVAFSMYDSKHELMPVTGSYTAEVTKTDGTVLCKASGELTPADFSEKGTHKAPWHDASCPKDPEVDELKVVIKVTVPGAGGKDDKDKGKDDKDKDKDAAKDMVFDREARLAAKAIYERLPKKPAETKPADGSAAKPAEKPADGSAAKPAETKPAEKPAEKPADKPAEKPAEAKPAEKP